MEAAIEVDDVSKRFRIYAERQHSLKATILKGGRRSTHENFWALRDVTFAVPQGSTFGLIGHNGSGKSTLLKCMARILRPDSGTIRTVGQVSALLELGAGFHPELSGRENVYLNASILGLTKRDVDLRFDDIVDFAGLEQFIDSPVKNYSSGMYVRLGFSVAISIEPDVLLVDEVLSVGDEEFQQRSAEKFGDLRRSGCTIVVVSHAMDTMRNICDEVAWLDEGRLRDVGSAGHVIDDYLRQVRNDRRHREAKEQVEEPEVGESRGIPRQPNALIDAVRSQPLIESVEMLDANGQPTTLVKTGSDVVLRVRYAQGRIAERVTVAVGLYRLDGVHLASINCGDQFFDAADETGSVAVDFHVESLPLLPGIFEWSVALHDQTMLRHFERADRCLRFDVEPGSRTEYVGLVALGGTWRRGDGARDLGDHRLDAGEESDREA